MALSQAGDLVQQVQDMQRQMGEIQEMLRANANSGLPIPRPEPPKTASDPHSRIPGTSWSEEMDIIDPIGPGDDGEEPEEDTAGQRRVVEVSQRTEEHLLRSFASMKNADRRRLADGFALPKVAVTRTPLLDTVMSAQCSKTTKTLDKALARIQTLNLDALAPLIDLLEQLNGEKEITSDQVGYAVESAITLLGNASAQMSTLRRQKVLEEYNRDLLSFAQGREAEFLAAAPQLFGPKFPGDAAEHLDQLAALRKAKASTSSTNPSVFRKASAYQTGRQRSYVPRQRPPPYARSARNQNFKKGTKDPK